MPLCGTVIMRRWSRDCWEPGLWRALGADVVGLSRVTRTRKGMKGQARDMWRYRDWVIEALNRICPLTSSRPSNWLGTCSRSPRWNRFRYGFPPQYHGERRGRYDNEEFRVAAVKDRVDTTMQVWMGLTMGAQNAMPLQQIPLASGITTPFTPSLTRPLMRTTISP